MGVNMAQEKIVSIGEAARKCGLSVRRVRYMSDQGYIEPPVLTVSGDITYRFYTIRHIEQIKKIKSLQDEGCTLRVAALKARERRSSR
ncbi:MAG: MerR family transcriptional regulator [Bacteroidia bacterium]|nr:MerR family transcriptional regulator [Bacteroidia bacterium]